MIRHLAYLAPLAVLGLAACDNQAALTKAKDGDCFVAVGKMPNGQPKLERTECAGAETVTAPIEGVEETAAIDPATGQPVTAAAPAAQCPQVPVGCPTAAAAAPAVRVARAERRSNRTARAKAATRSRSARSVVEDREYTRVYTPDYAPQPLLGEPGVRDSYQRSENYSYSYNPPAPIQPPPPRYERYERRDEAYAGGHHERHGEAYAGSRAYERSRPTPAPRHHMDESYAYVPPPPPPPPPPHVDRRGHRESYQSGGRYSRQETYSSSQYESRSYSSSSSGSRYGAGYGCPNRCPPERGPVAPMNGPHFPIDQDGFLTWRGKTP